MIDPKEEAQKKIAEAQKKIAEAQKKIAEAQKKSAEILNNPADQFLKLTLVVVDLRHRVAELEAPVVGVTNLMTKRH